MLAKEIMTTDVLSVKEDQSFNQVELLAELKNVRHIPVLDGFDQVVGIVSVRDLLGHLSNAAASHFSPVSEVMERNPITVSPETPVKEVAQVLLSKGIGCVPVVEGGKLVGIVSDRDFVRVVGEGK